MGSRTKSDAAKPERPARPFEQSEHLDPIHAFRFEVRFYPVVGDPANAFSGAFSEISGLEATMEPIAYNEGGRNWGQAQLPGRTTFSTVILRRGMTTTRHITTWFDHFNMRGNWRKRFDVVIVLYNLEGSRVLKWRLKRAIPVKLKLADLSAIGQEVGIEELHLNHEGLIEEPGEPAGGS